MIVDGTTYVTEKEIASKYDKSVRWIRKLRYIDKDLPYYKLNGRIFFNLMEIEDWFKNRLKQVQ